MILSAWTTLFSVVFSLTPSCFISAVFFCQLEDVILQLIEENIKTDVVLQNLTATLKEHEEFESTDITPVVVETSPAEAVRTLSSTSRSMLSESKVTENGGLEKEKSYKIATDT